MIRLARRFTATAVGIGMILSLSACGRVGTLDQPAPLWGARAKADYQARKAADAAKARADKDDGAPDPLDPSTPGLDPHGPGTDTLRQQPGTGMRPLPGAAAPAGVLPDPYTRPQ
jgi:hypothetical protein